VPIADGTPLVQGTRRAKQVIYLISEAPENAAARGGAITGMVARYRAVRGAL
jgi:hypothetical protein